MNAAESRIQAWPASIAGALVLFIGLMIWVAVIAVQSDPGRLEIHPYEKGLGYEAVLSSQRELQTRGWSATVEAPEGTGPGVRVLKVAITDASGRPVSGLSGKFEAIRPADSRADRVGTLDEEAGRYEAPIEFTQPGLWLLKITFEGDGARISLPDRWITI